jgi:two-component system chemotaxis response regulator CheB
VAKRDIIVIGGSAGAAAALHQLVADFSPDLQASVFIVTHVPVHGAMLLAGLLEARTKLPVAYAQDGDPILPGRILVGPPDRHLLLTPDGVSLGLGPRENLSRPAVDALFRSAAVAFGGRVIGVVLTGMLNDGAAGLVAVQQCGGVAVVQDPLDAQSPEMPRAALRAVQTEHVVPMAGMARLLESLAREEAPLGRPASPTLRLEVDIAQGERLGAERLSAVAEPSTFNCPNCNGVLSEMKGEGPLRFRCQIGHAVTGEILDDCHERALERAMGVALRIVEERIALVRRLAEDARILGATAAAELHEARAEDYAEQADILRRAVLATVRQHTETADAADYDPPPAVA